MACQLSSRARCVRAACWAGAWLRFSSCLARAWLVPGSRLARAYCGSARAISGSGEVVVFSSWRVMLVLRWFREKLSAISLLTH